jgi:pyruvate dehydrogenase phosphatase
MVAEHPPDEAPYVIQRGRVLGMSICVCVAIRLPCLTGGLEPTRAFGDANYKWPKELQERYSKPLLAEQASYD